MRGEGERGIGEGNRFVSAEEGGGVVDGEALVGDDVCLFGGGEGVDI